MGNGEPTTCAANNSPPAGAAISPKPEKAAQIKAPSTGKGPIKGRSLTERLQALTKDSDERRRLGELGLQIIEERGGLSPRAMQDILRVGQNLPAEFIARIKLRAMEQAKARVQEYIFAKYGQEQLDSGYRVRWRGSKLVEGLRDRIADLASEQSQQEALKEFATTALAERASDATPAELETYRRYGLDISR